MVINTESYQRIVLVLVLVLDWQRCSQRNRLRGRRRGREYVTAIGHSWQTWSGRNARPTLGNTAIELIALRADFTLSPTLSRLHLVPRLSPSGNAYRLSESIKCNRLSVRTKCVLQILTKYNFLQGLIMAFAKRAKRSGFVLSAVAWRRRKHPLYFVVHFPSTAGATSLLIFHNENCWGEQVYACTPATDPLQYWMLIFHCSFIVRFSGSAV